MNSRRARLDLLFSGDDSHLLGVNTQRYFELPPEPGPKKADPQQPPEPQTSATTTKNNNNSSDGINNNNKNKNEHTIQSDSMTKHQSRAAEESDEEGFDEYLSAFSDPNARHGFPTTDPEYSNGRSASKNKAVAATSDDLGVKHEAFCPIVAFSRFPYKYIHGPDRDVIAKQFFDGGKFWARSWVLYYIWPPHDVASKPLSLVAISQVKSFIDEINAQLDKDLKIPDGPDIGFVLRFSEKPDGTPRPQFLGVTHSRDEKDQLEQSAAPPREGYGEAPAGASQEVLDAFEAFRVKVELGYDATRNKKRNKGNGKGGSASKKKDTTERKLQGWHNGMKQMHNYLGLLPKQNPNAHRQPDSSEATSWEQQVEKEHQYRVAAGQVFDKLDFTKPPIYPFHQMPVFICVDVESNERVHSMITEIGVSTLDTADLVDVPPGENGRNWMEKIRTRHFRVTEYAHIINTEYVHGCPDRFHFGESEFVPLKDTAAVVDSCFLPPYSANTNPTSDIPERNLIMVGHDVQMDVKYLQSLGCRAMFEPERSLQDEPPRIRSSVPRLHSRFINQVDTSLLYRVLKRSTQATSLGNVLVDLDLQGWHLHNAGNDAHYTMQALIGIAVKARALLDAEADGLGEQPDPLDTDKLAWKAALAKQSLF